MANRPLGTERPLVEACQTSYNGGWVDKSQRLAACTLNAAKFVSNYSIFGLQEVNGNYRLALQSAIQSAKADADFGFLVAQYSGQTFVMLGYDRKITGPATELYRGLLVAIDQNGETNPDQRAIQAVYFAKLHLVVVNLHAAHRIDLKNIIQKTLSKVQLPAGIDIENLRVVMMGDFNDETGSLLNSSISLFGHDIMVPDSKPVFSCCTDSGYRLPGDYIMLSENLIPHIQGEYGFPPGYQRYEPLMSDHDPIAVMIRLPLSGIRSIAGTYTGIVVTSGDYVELRILDIDEDELVKLGKTYVKQQGLGWKIRKPHAWTDYDSGPHVTLHPNMKKYIGQRFQVKLTDQPYHFVSSKSRWVVLPAEFPQDSPLQCEHECHLSIAQQRT